MPSKHPLTHYVTLMMAGFSVAPLFAATGDAGVVIHVTEGRSAGAAIQSEPVLRLATNPSVSLSRMGGRGLDPVIHGQSEERVDVLMDGMRVEGACPSRMDPPTSRLSTALSPLLEVRTGNRTLRWGPITGGQVLATTAAPAFAEGKLTTGHLTLGGSDNGAGRLVNGSVAVGGKDVFLRAAGGYDEADDYEDGDGQEVRSAYQNSEGRLDGAWQADNGFFIRGLVSRQEERDVKFPGRGMDAPETDTDLYRLEVGAPVPDGGWSLMAWQADVDHVMDNFSLRESTMKMQTSSATRTRGARLVLDQIINVSKSIAVGVDVESNEWDATLYNGMNLDNQASLMWPGVERDRVGIFLEAFHQIRINTRLGAGIRYDRVEMDATRADQTFQPMPGGMMLLSPAGLYAAAYGTTDTEALDDNVSGFLTGEWRFAAGHTLEITASHSVRSPGVNERYVAQRTMRGSWVGNPDLDTEKHNKLEAGVAGRGGNWHWRPAIWVDQVEDYVYRFTINNPDGVTDTRYRNIDARLLGVEGVLGWNDGTWSSTSKLASVRGENREADRALPRIPPIQFIQTLGWRRQGHEFQAEWQLARRQDRIDPMSGLDPGTSPGYGVVNLSGTHPLMKNLSLTWAVDNLFDNTWARHVSKDNLADPGVFRVNEPGRILRAAVTARW